MEITHHYWSLASFELILINGKRDGTEHTFLVEEKTTKAEFNAMYR